MDSTITPGRTTRNGTRTALVLGASGSIGGAVSAALLAHGWAVRGLARHPDRTRLQGLAQGPAGSIEWLAGDAMVREDVVAAAAGVQVIVHAVSPPGYRDWDRRVLPMMDNTIAAARAAGGARILLPGTIYNVDAARTPLLLEDGPQRPASRKGKIRVELERRLEAVSGEVPVLIVRAGDYFGPRTRSSWFAQAMVTTGRPVRRLTHLAPHVGHAWAYLPDLAETMVRLLEHPGLRPFERVGFEGFWDPDGRALPALVAQAVGAERLPERTFPWWLMRLAAPFGGFAREAVDILPYWRHSVRIDNRRLLELLGAEPRTPALEAMRRTLQGLACLPEPAQAPGLGTPTQLPGKT
ncbi:NAD(P)H-binding protein [Mitsuaria sp. WAJ17]|uniref:NAD(P)H-binding protein n=1 Tax=Mitsuaria sp. WAJ17 TaxID=2761452 RepID=UPI00160374C9|nr:NAD(P)H-binding protein [Mitsuaria sp. WAJ17]MBB2483626.1 NAD(P)H-binding protein [Mitsuaria sp. WAJ17]